MVPTWGHHGWDSTGPGSLCGVRGLWGGRAARSGAGAQPGGGGASLPLFLPLALGPSGQSGSNRRFLPRRKGCLASHAINPQTKGPLSPRRSQSGPAPTPALPPEQYGCSPAPRHWDPRPRSPQDGPSRPGASCSLAAAAGFHKPDVRGCRSPVLWSRGSLWGPLWGGGAASAPQAPRSIPVGPKAGASGTAAAARCQGVAAGRSRFLAARWHAQPTVAPTSISRAPWPGLLPLHGHLPAPEPPWHHPMAAATGGWSTLSTPHLPCPALGRGSYPVGGGRQGLDAEQQAVRQAQVAVAVAAEVLACPHQLVDLQARQPGHGCCGGDDGRHDLPSDPLALRTEGMSPAAPHGMRTLDPPSCLSHSQPVGRGNAVVLCTQVGCCRDKVHMDVVVLQRRVWGH